MPRMRPLPLLISIHLLCALPLHAQHPNNPPLPFQQTLNLTHITNPDSIQKAENYIAAMFADTTQRNSGRSGLVLFGNWEFAYCMQQGYTDLATTRQVDSNDIFSLDRKGPRSYFIGYTESQTFSGFTLFHTFGLSRFRFPISEIPNVSGRNSQYNSEWTAISPDPDHLIIRYVSSYPDGSLTSWYWEVVYYFEWKAGD